MEAANRFWAKFQNSTAGRDRPDNIIPELQLYIINSSTVRTTVRMPLVEPGGSSDMPDIYYTISGCLLYVLQ